MKKNTPRYILCLCVLMLAVCSMCLVACQVTIVLPGSTEKTELSLHFDSNGGVGDMQAVSFSSGQAVTLPRNTFERLGYTFAGWATSPSGEVVYTDGEKIKLHAGSTLYAVWQMEEYNIYYILPGGELDYTNVGEFSLADLPLTFMPPTGRIEGYEFEGWYTSSDFSADSELSSLEEITKMIQEECGLTLYAKYRKSSDPDIPVEPGENTQPMLPIAPGEQIQPMEPIVPGQDIEPMLPITPGESVEQDNNDFTFAPSSDSSYYIITGYTGMDKDIVLPSVYQGKPVKEIAKNAFSNRQGLTSVTLPEGIIKIGESAFDGCTSLVSVTLPSSISYIDLYAFYGCESLRDVHISDVASWCGVTFRYADANPLKYAHHLYFDDSEVTNLVIPGGVTSISDYVFYGASGLVSVDMPASVTAIGQECFMECGGLQWLTVHDIASWCGVSFADKYSNPLYWAHNLYLGQDLVTDLSVPSGVRTISEYAFVECTSIKSVNIASTVEGVGAYAFAECEKITKVNTGDIASWCSITFGNDKSNPMYYSRCLYVAGEPLTHLSLPDGVKYIRDYALYRCASLESVDMPESVISVGDYAFYQCEKLANITLSDRLESIGENAFTNCFALSRISLPDTLKSIGGYAFMECTALSGVSLPDSVTSLGEYAFARCTSLASARLGAGIKSVNEQVFAGCESLERVSMSDGVTSIDDYAFWHCYSLRDIHIPTSLESIGKGAFNTCSSLASVDLPSTLTSIGADAFSFCSGLYSVFIPSSVGYVGGYAFANCDNLELYLERESEPSDWDRWWNVSGQKVILSRSQDITYTFESEGEQVQSVTTKGGVILPTLANDIVGGKYFLGWYDNASFTGQPLTTPYRTSQNTTLYAKWGGETEYDSHMDWYRDGSSFARAKVASMHNVANITKEGQMVYFAFTPTEGGEYVFSSDRAKSNAYLSLYDEHKQMLEYSYGRFDFELSYTLQAGKTYYLAVNYSEESVVGEIAFDIAKVV